MDSIMEIARGNDLCVIEDVAQADGGWYKGKRLGTIGDVGCFSLDFYKTITSGEGGVMTFKDEWLYIRAQSYHDTAACWRPDRFAKERMPGELFSSENYRMSELQAAVALAQLRKLDERIRGWNNSYQRIVEKLDLPGEVQHLKDNDPGGGCRYILGVLWPDRDLAEAAQMALEAEGIYSSTHDTQVRDWHVYNYWEHILDKKTVTEEGCPYTCPYYKGKMPDYSADMCPKTLDYLSRAVFIPISYTMKEKECDQVAHGINKVAEVLIDRCNRGEELLIEGNQIS